MMISRILFSMLLLFVISCANGQNQIDSLLTVLKKHPSLSPSVGSDTIRINTLNSLSWEYISIGDYDKAMLYTNEAVALAAKISPSLGGGRGRFIAVTYNNIGIIHSDRGNYDKAIEYHMNSLKIREEIGDKKGMARSYNNIGNIQKDQGNYDKAIEYHLKSLKIKEENRDKNGMSNSYNNIGNIYAQQANYDKAMEYHLKSLKIKEEIGDKKGMANSYNNIGGILYDQGKYDKVMEYFMKSLKLKEEIGDKKGIAMSYTSIGFLYTTLYEKDTAAPDPTHKRFILPRHLLLDSARHYQLKSYLLGKEIGDKNIMIYGLNGLGNILSRKKSYKEALRFYEQAASLADSIGAKKELYEAYGEIATAYNKLGNGTKAFEYYKKHIALRDAVQSEESKEKTIRGEMQHEYDKKATADSVRVAEEKKVVAAQLESEKTQRYGLYGGLFLMFALAGVSYRGYRTKRKANVQLAVKNNLIEKQKHLVEEKQKEILDSINYAKRIQAAVLPPSRIVKEYLPDSFILYKPKDIVAGDFYWIEQKEDKILFAAADCTGHGVPGAMVSVICNNGLNRSVREHGLTGPGKILNKTREIIIQEFEKSDEEVKDGMDISLCTLNKKTGELKWAGANNPLWIIRKKEIIEFKPDKQPIGKYAESKSFTTHTIELQKGDIIYLFTDGYADQFGGEKGKKFKYAKLKELLLSISDKPMNEQKEILNETFETWKGKLEQVDDVCVIGVRI